MSLSPCTVTVVILELGSDYRYDVSTRSLVMGILNRTPDSFWDRGRFWGFDEFLRLAERHVSAGADIFDIGGSKAAPGPEVTAAEELERVVPAVEALRSRFDLPIAVDTFRGAVADAAMEAGACIGNDISGFADPTFLPACARHGATVVATHVRIGPRISDPKPDYTDDGGVVAAVKAFLAERIFLAEEAGIPHERIVIDAGLDLGKTPAMSIELLRNSDTLSTLGRPVLLSASNKGFLGELGGDELTERVEATWAAHALGITGGCRILRAHDVRGARRVADVMAIVLTGELEVIGTGG